MAEIVLEAIYKVATPLFMAGADQSRPELRPPSLKGLLRFWYRATSLGRYGSWEQVQEEENRLFGSTEGQGAFTIQLAGNEMAEQPPGQIWPGSSGAAYLGYGVLDGNKGNRRGYIKPASRFTLRLYFTSRRRDTGSEPDTRGLVLSLMALGLLGGAGSRSRRGYGSLNLESLRVNGEEKYQAPTTLEKLKQTIEGFLDSLGPLPATLPEYSALSKRSRIIISDTASDPIDLLEKIGRQMLRYRSYGSSHGGGQEHRLPWGERAKQLFADDHDNALAVALGRRPEAPPRRVVFGLPHNYYFRSLGRNVAVKGTSNLERRTSPLLLHIHQVGQQYAAVLTFIPARFLPAGEQILMQTGGKQMRYSVSLDLPQKPDPDWRVIDAFLNSFSPRLEVKIP
ncbi:type III-B CRISPR module RAMP protein Cmr1 [Moorella naiadis]|uniref:type III-B CRISPR module RAMP protein Cmr1 n=1 Tax=Moorella naiadis (nom. illeg.) TaxID=3093670 RepID=UPI003D9C87B2